MTRVNMRLWWVLLIAPVTALSALHQPNFEPGDQAFLHRNKATNAWKALKHYRHQSESFPTNFEAHWRLSMACQFVGQRLAEPRHRSMFFEEGQNHGKRAIALNPKCAACHFWTAINMALYGREVGVLKTLFTLGEIQSLLQKTSELDAHYAYAGPARIQGIIEESLPGILGGSNARAEEYFRKALDLEPNPLNYLFLAKLLVKEGRAPEASAVAKQGLERKAPPDRQVEAWEAWNELKTLLDSLNGVS